MSIKLKWVAITDADIASFNIYRSMIGFRTSTEAPFSLINGDTLQLKFNDQTVQTVTFTGDDAIADLVTLINGQITGGTAYKEDADNSLIIRSDIRIAPGFVEIVGGTAVAKMSETARIISEKSETELIGNVLFAATHEYTDADGVLEDFYAISTIDGVANESDLSSLRQPINFTGPICVVEGTLMDLQGVRQSDKTVTARIVSPPEGSANHSFVTNQTVSILTGEDGRFSLPLLQGAKVIFEIDDARISDPILIPAAAFVFFDDLNIDTSYIFKDS